MAWLMARITSSDIRCRRQGIAAMLGNCYANVSGKLCDRNAHMEIWLRVNCSDLYNSNYFTYKKTLRVMS